MLIKIILIILNFNLLLKNIIRNDLQFYRTKSRIWLRIEKSASFTEII